MTKKKSITIIPYEHCASLFLIFKKTVIGLKASTNFNLMTDCHKCQTQTHVLCEGICDCLFCKESLKTVFQSIVHMYKVLS